MQNRAIPKAIHYVTKVRTARNFNLLIVIRDDNHRGVTSESNRINYAHIEVRVDK